VKMVSGNKCSYANVMKREIEVPGEWKYPVAIFFVVMIMVSLLVLLLPDTPFEFW